MDSQNGQTVAIFDLDSTITSRDTHVPFYLAYLRQNPLKWLKALPPLMAAARYLAGDRDRKKLKEAFLNSFLGGVPHVEASAFAKTFAQYWMERHVYPGARAQIGKHKQAGHVLILATASYHLYADHMAEILGFDHVIATQIVLDGEGRIIGKLTGENCRGDVKRDAVRALLAASYPSVHRVFYSDDLADRPLLEDVDEAFLVNPNTRTHQYGKERGLPILDWRTTAASQDAGSV